MNNTSTDMIAVFDLGSARTKLLIGTRDPSGAFRLIRKKVETGIEGKIAVTGKLKQDARRSLLYGLSELVTIARDAGCHKYISIATEAFRNAENGPDLVRITSDLVESSVVLSPSIEGLLFYLALRQSLFFEDGLYAMDVGGSSVQVVWGESEAEVASLPTGTFRLERDYHNGHTPASREYAAMESHIRRCVRSALPRQLTTNAMVVGSNYMAEFLVSAMNFRKVNLIREQHTGLVSIGLEEISGLLEEIKWRPYETLQPYYPSNPKFMFGADKALLNVIAVAEFLHADKVFPTDESVSTALARVALLSPDVLGRYGIAIHNF